MKKVLTPSFFSHPTLRVARRLLGKYIVSERKGKKRALMITEVEAYDGPLDLASHASRGMTPRTTIMFGDPGRFYVYFTYGMHWLVNIVTGRKGYPAAVLIRAGAYRDPRTGTIIHIKGPARLTKFLGIDKAENGKRAAKKTGVWIEDRGVRIAPKKIATGPRVGVAYAGPLWSAKPYNFGIRFLRVTELPLAE